MSNQITRSMIVKGDITTVFNVWADYETFPSYMTYVQRVTQTGPHTSEWEVSGPLGSTLTWTAETTRFEPDKRIAWNTKDHDGNMTTSGEVVFNELPEDHTHLTVTMNYAPPGGEIGELLASILSDPARRLDEDLRNFKAYIESGLHRERAGYGLPGENALS